VKKNLPVTKNEKKMRHDEVLVSRTDRKGHITYANKAFCEMAGYSQDELLGKAHNIVRHPDMPPSAFQDLWDTVKAGRPWTGIVKNRCKNGDYYWVVANVSPEYGSNGRISGYISIRTKPTQEQVTEASAKYAKVNSGETSLPATLKAGLYSKLKIRTVIIAAMTLITTSTATSIMLYSDISSNSMGNVGLLSGFLMAGCIGAFILMLIATHKTAKPLKEIVDGMQKIVEGNFDRMPSKFMHDELGDVADNIKTLQAILRYEVFESKAMETEKLYQQQKVKADKTRAQHHLATTFENHVGSLVSNLTNEAGQISSVASKLDSVSDNLTVLSKNTLQSVVESSSHVSSTAAAIEEMSTIITDVSQQVIKIQEVSGEAVRQAKSATQKMEELSAVSLQISSIVAAISDIAEQTNLLALNASIEAARAGAAGRGFSVVAGEVKELANQTSLATKQIRDQIEGIQTDSKNASQLISETSATIHAINDFTTNVATAMEQQSAASREISEAAQHSNLSMEKACRNAEELSDSVKHVDASSDEMVSVTISMSRRIESVQDSVRKFIEQVS